MMWENTMTVSVNGFIRIKLLIIKSTVFNLKLRRANADVITTPKFG